MQDMLSTREVAGKALLELGKENKNIVTLTNDAKFSCKVEEFERQIPDRFFEVGIAEQNMMGIAAGFAVSGKIPFVNMLAFLIMRCYDQIRGDVAYPRLNVKIMGTSSGLSLAGLGSTHHCLVDIAIMRALPNMTVIVPADAIEAEKVTRAVADYQGPVYVRLGRGPTAVVYHSDYHYSIGKGITFRDGKDVTIIAAGVMVSRAIAAAEKLAGESIEARVINIHTIKPIDSEIIVKAAKETKGIVTIEEHNVVGGLGSAVAEALGEKFPVPVRKMGIPDTFSVPGPSEELYEKYGLTVSGIVKRAKGIYERNL